MPRAIRVDRLVLCWLLAVGEFRTVCKHASIVLSVFGIVAVSFVEGAWAQQPKPRHGEWVKVVEVISGDVLVIERRGVREEVVLFAIETPGPGRPFSDTATAFTRERCLGKNVMMLNRGTDAKGRITAEIFHARRRSINRELIAEGLARTHRGRAGRSRSRFQSLLTSQLAAVAGPKGIWTAWNPDAVDGELGPFDAPRQSLNAIGTTRALGRNGRLKSTEYARRNAAVFATIPEYEIVEQRDFSHGLIKRYEVVVTLKRRARRRQYEEISAKIMEDIVRKEKINALAVAFYLKGMDIQGRHSLANVYWAPGGNWLDADRVAAGSYSTHQFSVQTGRN